VGTVRRDGYARRIVEGKAKNVDGIRQLMSANICRCSPLNILAAIRPAMGQS
jgi:aerobic-type carbon monoxide dehydrogenase small subunit (CoxS/CutS family)